MRYGAIFSGLLHLGILIVVIVGLPGILRSDRAELVPISVEVVSVEELSKQTENRKPPEPVAKNPPPDIPEPPRPAKQPPPPPTPVATPAPTPPPPAAPPPPEVKPEPVPTPEPKPEAAPVPKPKVKPAPPKEPETQVAAKTPPAPAPQRKPDPPAPKPDEFQSLLKNLDRQKRAAEKAKADAPAQVAKQAEEKPQRSALQARMMAASLAQAVNRQVAPCWSIPTGAKDASNMSVAIRIRLNPDGTLGAAPQVEDTRRLGSDTSFRAVAESALRALRNPGCTPLKLPFDQYDLWKEITFVFDPREALGQ